MTEAPVCPASFYGPVCDKPCPSKCQGQVCNKDSGFCNGCEPGWKGINCDTACEFGKFGRGCTQFCSYQCYNVACNAVDGVCDGGCAKGYKPPDCNVECDPGFQGYNCTDPCPSNCDGTCHIKSGNCISGCLPGYMNDHCDKECDVTFYGLKCQEKCNPECVNSECHHVTGVCKDCPPGKTGDQCERDCSLGSYGNNCANKCSENCWGNKTCNSLNGECTEGCNVGYTGLLCDKTCDKMKYGKDCKSNCSQSCVTDVKKGIEVCHHVSGDCKLGCVNGYEGLQCTKLKATDNGFNAGAVAGPVIVILLLAVIMAIGVFVWRRKKRTKYSSTLDNGSTATITESENLETHQNNASTNRSAQLVDKPTLYSTISDLTQSDKRSGVYNNTIPGPFKTAIAVEDLNIFMLSHSKEYFVEQFKKIPSSCNSSMAVGLSAENKHKNRYKNICPYDHSRVQLLSDGEKGQGDYINASYVQGYNNKEKFIASQGPNKAILEDFIRLLWEQKSDIVIMLTNLVEEGKHKCEKYWPEENELVLGEISIKLLATQMFSDYIVRKMQLTKAGQPAHSLTQFHFTAWPDKGVPNTPWSLIDFEHRVRSHPTDKPIVVHCSAGVGRTGTFIALQNVIREAEVTGCMDFYTTLSKLREDRVSMIQTVEQYIFLHEAAQVALVCLRTTVTPSDILQRINALEDISASGQTSIEREFKAVCNVCTNGNDGSGEGSSGGSTSSTYLNSRTLANKVKNRFSNILPKEYYRPHLFCETKDMGEYINAVLVPSLTKQNSQILTQLPLPTTVLDFWRLVSQYNVSLIVAFEMGSDDSTVGAYLPSESVPLHCGSFEIETKSKHSDELWEEKVVSIIKQKKRKTSSLKAQRQDVTHIKSARCDFDPEHLLTVVQQIRSHRSGDNSRVLYMCRNGADYSGLFCVLSQLLDRQDKDRQLMVPLVVGAIKAIRPQVIPTLDQYRTLYQVLKLYTESTNTYNSCDDHDQDMVTSFGMSNYAFEKNESEDGNIYANS